MNILKDITWSTTSSPFSLEQAQKNTREFLNNGIKKGKLYGNCGNVLSTFHLFYEVN